MRLLPAFQSVRLNATDLAHKYPLAAKAVDESFYVDDGVTGADSTEEAIELQKQLQDLFFQFKVVSYSVSGISMILLYFTTVTPELKDSQTMHNITDLEMYTKTLGIEWNTNLDHFRLTIADLPPLTNVTKRLLVSDIDV